MALRDDIWIWLPLVGAGLGLLAAATDRQRCVTPTERGQWVDPDAPRRIRAIASRVEAVTGLHGLGDFLSGVAYVESRGNPKAGPSTADNRARGWFGMRPESARLEDIGLPLSALKDEEDAVALAVWYIHRCQPYADEGQVIDWLAVRRCWGYPSDVDDIDHPGYADQLAYGLAQVGVPCNLMYVPVFGPDYRWPGMQTVLAAARGVIA